MTTITYMGRPLNAVTEATLEFAMTDAGKRWAEEHFVLAEREMRIDLPLGKRWPEEMKRGRPVTFDVMGLQFDGRIAWRRMHRLVVKGVFR